MDKTFWIVIVAGLVTMGIRFAPFVLFSGKTGIPRTVKYLGNLLPPAIMGTLIIFALKHIDLGSGARGIPEILGVLATVALHVWKRNTLLSIAGATILYMLLLRLM